MAKRHNIKIAHHLYKRMQANRCCVYCGIPADTMDHVLPVSVAAMVDTKLFRRGIYLTVPSCRECNSLAGNKLFKGIGPKRRYIQARLAQRGAKLLQTPKWTAEQIEEMGPTMRKEIINRMAAREYLLERLAWRNSFRERYERDPEYDAA